MHNLAEAMQDAQISGKDRELHVVSADLSKAFDSLEHWSQAMSWRALGMPQEMAEMLMKMDQQGETAVILGQGRNTAEVLGEAGWFESGRGVRQGSIGGPIKWIVYMNFWLKYIHKKHKGQGYHMSKASLEDLQLLGQMFIDDSNWFSGSLKGIQEIMLSNETFVGFHGLSFNMKKCEYIVMNQREEGAEWERPLWSTGQVLVETIRVLKDKDKWEHCNAKLESAVSEARAQSHSLTETQPLVGDKSWEWVVALDAIHEEMTVWEKLSEKRWWAQNTDPSSKDEEQYTRITSMVHTLLKDIYGHGDNRATQAITKVGVWRDRKSVV